MKQNKLVPLKEDAKDRVNHFNEFHILQNSDMIEKEAGRCLDCGVAFCNYACPLGNVLPDLNYLVAHNKWDKALEMLHKTNNFPEFTGRLCPALCEASCSLAINSQTMSTKEIELSIIEYGFKNGKVKPLIPFIKTDKSVAVIGSGPAGLTVAQQLIRMGHEVMVYEKARDLGGILSLGIPDYKLDKSVVERRIDQLRQEGVNFSINTHVGVDIKVDELINDYDAVCLCGGSSVPRSLDVDGSALKGIHHAMDYLIQQNDINQGIALDGDRIDAKDKNVVIIGGGDTGADCLGVALRQGAKDVYQIELMPEPPKERTNEMPWPYWPMVLKTNTAHEEGGERLWSIATKRFSGVDGHVKEIHGTKLEWIEEDGSFKMKEVKDSNFILEADLVLFAMGFLHPEQEGVIKSLNLDIDRRGNIKADKNQTNQAKIFTAGDMHLGQSLVCKAIADGRKAAKSIGIYLNDL